MFTRTLKNNIIKECFKNHCGVNFLPMGWQIIKSLGSSIKLSLTDYFPCINKDLHTVELDNSNSDNYCSRTRTKFPFP